MKFIVRNLFTKFEIYLFDFIKITRYLWMTRALNITLKEPYLLKSFPGIKSVL